MRIGLISDIHGNFTALEAVLANMNERPVDLLVCLGDVATIGPQPRQVLDKLKGLDCTFIMGIISTIPPMARAINMRIARRTPFLSSHR